MYTENKTKGGRWIHCVMRLSPPGVIFFASNAHPLPACGWEAHARRSAAKPDHLHAYFSEQSAHTLRGLQLSVFCPGIWGDMYTTTHKQNIHTYIYIYINIYIYIMYIRICTIKGCNRSVGSCIGQFNCSSVFPKKLMLFLAMSSCTIELTSESC